MYHFEGYGGHYHFEGYGDTLCVTLRDMETLYVSL